jgi:hypothetical protein
MSRDGMPSNSWWDPPEDRCRWCTCEWAEEPEEDCENCVCHRDDDDAEDRVAASREDW